MRRYQIPALIFSVIGFLIVIAHLFSGSSSTPSLSIEPVATPPAPQIFLELESAKTYVQGKYLYTEGEVKNIGNQPLHFVKAIVVFRDQNKVLVNSDNAYLDIQTFLPGQTSAFKITHENNPIITNADISFSGRIGDSSEDIQLEYRNNIPPPPPPPPAPTQKPKTSPSPSPAPKPVSKPTPPPPSPTPPAPSPTPTSTPPPAPQYFLELESYRFYRSDSGNYIYVEGEVKNIGTQALKYVKANASFRDQNNNFITSESDYLDTTTLLSGQTTTFKVSKTNDPAITQSTITFLGRIGDSFEAAELSYKKNIPPPPAPAPPPPPAAPKSWHTVASFSGTSEKNTDTFTIQGAQWRINWTAIGTSNYCLSSGCLFAVSVYDPGKGYQVDYFTRDISGTKNDANNFYKNGTFYLKISGSNIDSWQLTIEDYY